MNEQDKKLRDAFVQQCEELSAYWRERMHEVPADVWVVRTKDTIMPTYFTGAADGITTPGPLFAVRLTREQAQQMARIRTAMDEDGNELELEAIRLRTACVELAEQQEREANRLRFRK